MLLKLVKVKLAKIINVMLVKLALCKLVIFHKTICKSTSEVLNMSYFQHFNSDCCMLQVMEWVRVTGNEQGQPIIILYDLSGGVYIVVLQGGRL